MSSIWTCNICYISMPIADGPYHLVEDDHIKRLITRLSDNTIRLVNNGITNSFTTYGLTEEDPIDRFFESFSSFKYDSSLPPSTSYKHLQKHLNWLPGSPESNEIWETYQSALRQEFDLWYGAEDDLTAWHSLCRAIGINPLPTTCKRCKKAVRNCHINMIDLIHWGRSGGEANGKRVRIFRTVRELSVYSRQSGRIFKNTFHKDSEEGGVVLRHLLRHLFPPRATKHVSI
ncbi:uncharacterized protein BDZ99DRAFT_413999 [Mytilinidion resinicola]|uniref:Uncharacterized protein n=1 Tax=Mytilinidion resinicola TaxID=574789 RepID=A0A6A6YRT7_9PEZI|nr:uncharacterized protein BDZ99DRAFT_413999 [Mytilinidion resinicola]KAF2811520.1 hypothetical protein BDZ99DRAFT_413999 [Mytilinidion resinicola]